MAAAGPPRERIMREATRVLARGAQPSVAEIAKAAGVSRTTSYRTVAGRAGIARTLMLEATSMSPEFEQAFRETALRAFRRLAQYLATQMAAGRLRRMHPMVAVQSLVGAVMLHVLIGPLLSQAVVDAPSGEEAVTQFANLWLRGMHPETAG